MLQIRRRQIGPLDEASVLRDQVCLLLGRRADGAPRLLQETIDLCIAVKLKLTDEVAGKRGGRELFRGDGLEKLPSPRGTRTKRRERRLPGLGREVVEDVEDP